jgi:hypothetical protein
VYLSFWNLFSTDRYLSFNYRVSSKRHWLSYVLKKHVCGWQRKTTPKFCRTRRKTTNPSLDLIWYFTTTLYYMYGTVVTAIIVSFPGRKLSSPFALLCKSWRSDDGNLQPEFLRYQYNGLQVKLISSQGWLLRRLERSGYLWRQTPIGISKVCQY